MMTSEMESLCAELGDLSEEPARAAFLNCSPQLLDRGIVVELAEAVRRKVRVDVPSALRLANAAIVIARKLDDDHSLALAARAKANALWFLGQCRAAADLFQEAICRFESAGDLSEVGRTLSGSIQSLILLGEYASAIANAERARQIFTDVGDALRLARLDINVANIHHRQNHFSEALAAYERAYEQLLPLLDNEGVAVALHNMAVCRIALNDFPGALKNYQVMRTFCQNQEMPLLISQADYNIAYLYYLRGDYTEALELLRIARETCRQNGDSYHLGLCDLDQSEIYLDLKMVDEASEMAQRSFDLFKELGITFEAAKALSNLAVAAGLRGDVARALQYFTDAKEMLIREKNQAWPFMLDLYQALMLFDEGDVSGARRLCAPASDFFASAQMPCKYVQSLLLEARMCMAVGEFENARSFCSEAVRLASEIDSGTLTFDAHFLTGQVHEAVGESVAAWNAYQSSSMALETLHADLGAEELKISFMNDRADVYMRLAKLCLEGAAGQLPGDAFHYIEEAKSRALRDLLNERIQPPATAHTDETEIGRRTLELRKELNWFYRRIEREQLSQDGINLEVVESLRAQARSHERELLRRSREVPADIVGRSFRTSRTATVDQVRASLHPEAALVEYFSIENQLYAVVLTSAALEYVPLASLLHLKEVIGLLQFQLSKFQLGSDYVTRFREPLLYSTQAHLESLSSAVFGPLRPFLKACRHLVIVPCGILHALPFHALLNNGQSLIDEFTVSYASSASIYALGTEVRQSHASASLVLGVEDPHTPCVRQEVSAVASVLPNSEVLWGSEATVAALREKGRCCRMIHIATHGYFRQDSPMFSAIRLADGNLSLYDLYHMNLPVDLLTLSGCATGLSVTNKAEESLGLARGLLYAGARSLLLSLWDVDDRTTAEFMTLFYSHLIHGNSKAQALRAAMIDHRSTYPHPYYWAPFRLVGNALN